MTADGFRRYWNWISLRARLEFPVLSVSDLEVIGGEKDLFLGILRRRTGWEVERIEQWLDDLVRNIPRKAEGATRVSTP